MKLLLKAALQTRKHLLLVAISFVSMIMLAFATQLELFSLGVIAKAGPDVFTLFAPKEQGKLVRTDTLTLPEVEKRWVEITHSPDASLSIDKANQFIYKNKGGNLVERVSIFLEKHLQITTNLLRLAYFLVFVALFRAAALFLNRYITQVVAIRVSRDLRQRYFEHIQKLPLSFYHQYNIGSLSSRAVGDAGVIAHALNSLLTNYFHTPITAIATLAACCFISWRLSLVIFVGFPLIVLPIIYLAKKIKHIAKQMQRNQEGFASLLIDFLSGIMTVKVFAMEEFSLKKYKDQNNKMARLEEKSARYGLSSRPILHSIASLFFASVILYGIYVVNMGVAELLVFCALVYAFYDPVKKFAEENAHVLRGVAAAERMYEVLEITSDIQDAPNAVAFTEFKESIAFENVDFRYNDTWILKELSFEVKKGEMVAIVGPTGAGKSTIVQLLPRLYDVQKGEIKIDGKSIKNYTFRSLREMIAYVPQKPFLFIDSVKENISFGRSFSLEEVVDAAKKAYAHEFIAELEGQYDAPITEGGKNLSGGQQQRLAIARALVKKAPILILDEATSSLDAVSEGRIKEALSELRGSITQIIIAHRFSTIDTADRIIYLEEGRKVAEGTKKQLLETCPNFRRMWEMMHATK